jgi:monovalent cation:H+ antiporter-2, CPA2 family
MPIEVFLREAVLLLAAAIGVILLSARVRIPSVVGFLITGVLIGPSGLALIGEAERVELFAEIGVVFLLFSIGLEFSLERLAQIRRFFFTGGTAQAALTTGAIAALALGLGFSPSRAVFFGFLATLSSTALVLKLLADRRELDSPHGRIVLGILLFQDFLIVPMIILTPVLGGTIEATPAGLAGRFLLGLAVVGLVFVAGRYLMPRVLHLLVAARVREVLVLGVLAICLGLAWLTDALEFSLALGAFIAGILISETEYSHQVVAEVLPFRDVFNSIFFISIGMLLDVGFALAAPVQVLGLAAILLGVKALTGFAAVWLLRFPARLIVISSLSLAQVGEFSFVLLEVGREHGLMGEGGLFQLFLAAAILTMLATPVLMAVAPKLSRQAGGLGAERPEEEAAAEERRHDHVILAGFGVGGANVARVLRAAGLRYVVVEFDGVVAQRARKAGEPVLFGDVTRPEILEHAGIERARVLVFMISAPESVERSVLTARQMNPSLHIIARTRRVGEIEALHRYGADEVVSEEFETSIEVFTRVLQRYHVPRNVLRAEIRALRGEHYLMLRAPGQTAGASEAVLDALEAGTVDLFRLERGSPAVGRTLRELDLRNRTGATILSIVRGEKPIPNPDPGLTLETGDTLVLVGSHGEIEAAFVSLEPAQAPAGPA